MLTRNQQERIAMWTWIVACSLVALILITRACYGQTPEEARSAANTTRNTALADSGRCGDAKSSTECNRDTIAGSYGLPLPGADAQQAWNVAEATWDSACSLDAGGAADFLAGNQDWIQANTLYLLGRTGEARTKWQVAITKFQSSSTKRLQAKDAFETADAQYFAAEDLIEFDDPE